MSDLFTKHEGDPFELAKKRIDDWLVYLGNKSKASAQIPVTKVYDLALDLRNTLHSVDNVETLHDRILAHESMMSGILDPDDLDEWPQSEWPIR